MPGRPGVGAAGSSLGHLPHSPRGLARGSKTRRCTLDGVSSRSAQTRAHRIGMICVAAAAMLFASKGLFGKALYQRGVGFELLVAVRSVLALPLFVWVGLRSGARAPAVSGDDESQTLAIAPPPATAPRARAVLA